MTGYPSGDLDARIELKLAGAWTDITQQAIPDGGSYGTITSGQPDGAQFPNPSQLNATWDNPGGDFSPRNKAGQYYGKLRRNVPARVSAAGLDGTALRLEEDSASYASCPDAAGLHITGDIDIRADVLLTDWQLHCLAAKWPLTGGQQCWLLQLNGDGTLQLFWSTDGSNFPSGQSTAPLPYTSGRFAVRATLAVATGTVTFWTGPAGGADGSTWTQLGDPVVTGATSVFAGTTAVTAGNRLSGGTGMNGSLYELEVRSGIGGTVKAHPVFSAQSPGVTSFTDAQGNTWTMAGTAEISDRDYRLHGELSSIVPTGGASGREPRVAAIISGPLRRLQQGQKPPVLSAMRRSELSQAGDLALVAYWPCEDGPGSASVASGTGGPAMTISHGTPGWAADTSFLCSAPLPQLNGSSWHGVVPAYTSLGNIVVRFLLHLQDTPPANVTVVRAITTGTVQALSLLALADNQLRLLGQNAAGGTVFDSGTLTFPNMPGPVWVSMELRPDGSNVDWSLVTLAPGESAGFASSGSFAGTVGSVTDVLASPPGLHGATAVGHISAQTGWVSMFSLFQPLNAWQGETDGSRFARLAAENGYAARIIGSPGRGTPMGAQSVADLWALLQECQQAGQGLVFEPREALAVGYRMLYTLYNQAGGPVLSFPDATLPGGLTAADDDQDLVTDWTVSRQDGSSARAFLGDGTPMAADPGDVYQDSATVNVQSDAQLPDAAGWRLGVSSADEARYRQVTADFGIPGAPVQALARVRPGDLVTAASPPGILQTGDIRQIATGATETLGPGRQITWDCMPASPYDVAVAGTDRAAPQRAALYGPVTDVATTVDVAGSQWTDDPGDLPFGITADGEEMTVTAVAAGPGAVTGAYLSAGNYGGQDFTGLAALWQNWTGHPVRATRAYLGAFGAVTTDYSYSTFLQEIVAAGCRMCLTVQPAYNPPSPADRDLVTGLLSTLKAAGADVAVTIWHEPQGQGLTAQQYKAAVAYYAPAIRAYYPFWTVLSFQEGLPEHGYYPDPQYLDGVAVDQYWSSGITTFPRSQMVLASQFADKNGLPFAVWEFNTSAGPDYLTGDSYSFAAGKGQWTSRANISAITRVAVASGPFGIAGGALQITAAAAGNMLAGSGDPAVGTSRLACAPGDEITAGFWSQAATVGRTVQIGANFYNSSGGFISGLFDATAQATDTTGGWTSHYGKVTAPANAASCFLNFQVASAAAGEIHRMTLAWCANSSATGMTLSQSQAFWQWIQHFMASRAAAGRRNGDVILFSGGVPGSSTSTAVLHSSDYRLGLWGTLRGAVDGVPGPQRFTVTRAANGISNAHASGARVRLARLPVAAL